MTDFSSYKVFSNDINTPEKGSIAMDCTHLFIFSCSSFLTINHYQMRQACKKRKRKRKKNRKKYYVTFLFKSISWSHLVLHLTAIECKCQIFKHLIHLISLQMFP